MTTTIVVTLEASTSNLSWPRHTLMRGSDQTTCDNERGSQHILPIHTHIYLKHSCAFPLAVDAVGARTKGEWLMCEVNEFDGRNKISSSVSN